MRDETAHRIEEGIPHYDAQEEPPLQNPMKPGEAPTKNFATDLSSSAIQSNLRKIERREWLLWTSAIFVTLLLTLAIASFVLPMLHIHTRAAEADALPMSTAVRGLAGIVLLFDIYTIYQQLQIHRIRRQLLEREELFRVISENAADMIAVVDAQGNRIYNSPSYERVLGFSAEDLKNTSAVEQIHPDDRQRVLDAAAEARREGVGRRIEYRMRHKDGTWRFLESTASVVENSRGEVEKLIIVNRDITGRRQLEEQFRQAQKMEAVGRLSGGIAHDFNNLLGVIIGYSEVLQDRLPRTDPLCVSVDEILKAGKRAASLTRQLLAFSRQQVLDPRPLNLNSVVVDMERMLRRLIGEDIELATVLDPALGTIKADQGQLEQVIMNLIVNARDAMPEGGKLLIETRNLQIDQEFVRKYPYPVQQGPYICLTVTDSGTGMDAERQARIFEPFFTTKEKGKGTGLGLATVYGVVKQSGGYIDVRSALGQGTTFDIYLPRAAKTAERAELDTIQVARSSQGSETVLLVEDETSLRMLTRNLLELEGYRVLEAKDGADALEIAEKHPGDIAVLLTDVVMPGMNGRALAQELVRRRPKVKVVYMSGYTGQAVGGVVLDPGSIFLAKPFTRVGLHGKIREALDGKVLTEPKSKPSAS
jgi:two-component system, cell cycle sensor histidine kinase and response regulator CckA